MISSSQMTNSGERIERTMLHRTLQKTTTLFLGTPSENWITSIWESVDRSWVIAFSSLYIFAMFIFYILRLDSEHTWKPFFFFNIGFIYLFWRDWLFQKDIYQFSVSKQLHYWFFFSQLVPKETIPKERTF